MSAFRVAKMAAVEGLALIGKAVACCFLDFLNEAMRPKDA